MTDDKKKEKIKNLPETESKNPSSAIHSPSSETGGPKGPEPTRYGDWEINGKCVDF